MQAETPEREAPESEAPSVRPVAAITADRRADEQAALFRRLGVDVLHGPTMRTVDLSRDEALRAATAELAEVPPDFLVVTTGMGFRMWLEAAAGWGLDTGLRAGLARAQVLARGAKSAAAVRGAGLPVAWKAPNETMDEIVDRLRGEDLQRSRVAIQLFEPASHPATEALRAASGQLVEVPVYRWALPTDMEPARRLVEAGASAEVDAVTFTSQPAVRQLFRIAETSGQADALREAFNSGRVLPACVGPVCAEAAREEGIRRPQWPERARLPAMVSLVAERLLGGGATHDRAGNEPHTRQG